MRKMFAICAVVVLGCSTAKADDPAIHELAQAVFANMAVTYFCRNEVGIAHYQAARTIAMTVLAKQLGQKEAAQDVKTMDTKFRNDPRSNHAPLDANKCFELMSDAMFRVETASAAMPPP